MPQQGSILAFGDLRLVPCRHRRGGASPLTYYPASVGRHAAKFSLANRPVIANSSKKSSGPRLQSVKTIVACSFRCGKSGGRAIVSCAAPVCTRRFPPAKQRGQRWSSITCMTSSDLQLPSESFVRGDPRVKHEAMFSSFSFPGGRQG